MEQKTRDFFMLFGITLALFGIGRGFEVGHYVWWTMHVATLFFVFVTLGRIILPNSKN